MQPSSQLPVHITVYYAYLEPRPRANTERLASARDARLAGIENDQISDRHCDLVTVLTGGIFRVSLRIP